MNKRKSNIELLRIVSITMIVISHCAYKSGFNFEPGISANALIVKSLWTLGNLGVNLFMLISGYFMLSSRFKWQKLVLLLIELQFYYWLSILVAWHFGAAEIPTGKDLFLSFFPIVMNRWWFVTVYVVVYALSPYLNVLAGTLSLTAFRRFLLVLLCLFSLVPTIFGLFLGGTEGMLYYNRLVWLVIVYFLGAYLARLGRFSRKWAVWMTAVSAAVMVSSIAVIEQFSSFFAELGTASSSYFLPPNTFPMLMLSLGIFGLFLNLQLKHLPVINTTASASLGVYLLSDGLLAPWLWRDVFRCAEYQDSPSLVLRILGASAVVLIVGIFVDLARQQLERPLRYLLNHWDLPRRRRSQVEE